MTKRIIMLTAALAAGLLAQAPPPGGPRHHMQPHEAIKAHLNLTDSQVQALQQIQDQQRAAIGPMMQQIGQKHAALNDLLQKGGADPAAVGKLMIEIDALQKSISQKQVSFSDQARNTLTADQKTKLKGLEDMRKAMPAMSDAMALSLMAPDGPMHGPGGPPFGFAPDSFRPHGRMGPHGPPPPAN